MFRTGASMDQGALVTEQINAGASLIREFDRYAPLRTAFWLKGTEDGQWYLYLVSDRIDDSNFDAAYGEVLRLTGFRSTLWLDPFQVKVAGLDNPVAKSVLDVQSDFPATLGSRLRNLRLGDVNVDEVYIYALPATVP
jgi:hypothetical protein